MDVTQTWEGRKNFKELPERNRQKWNRRQNEWYGNAVK